MSQAEELLNSVETYTADETTEPHIVVGEDRFIVVPDELKRIAVQHDHNIETVTFDCPRYWDEHDMSQMTIYIVYERVDGFTGSYIATNVTVDETDDTIMHFDWCVSRNATLVKGELEFQICVKNNVEGVEVNHWNSEINREMYVSEGLECTVLTPDNPPSEEPDIPDEPIEPEEPEIDMSNYISKHYVRFYDYDGTLLYIYDAAAAETLTDMPELPTHEGLTAQGWNRTLSDVNTADRDLDIGALYITDDGTTRLYITIPTDGRLTVTVHFGMAYPLADSTVIIDWGDQSGTDTNVYTSGTTFYSMEHTYLVPGSFTITLTVSAGQMLMIGNGSDSCIGSMLNKVEIGANAWFTSHAFDCCYSLESVVLPEAPTNTAVSEGAFTSCFSLKHVTLPSTVTTIAYHAFTYCYSLKHVILPPTMDTVLAAFNMCYALERIRVPEGVNTLDSSAFASCSNLRDVYLPSTLTAIGAAAFMQCTALETLDIPDSVTTIGENAFAACRSLRYLYIPDGVTTIPNYMCQDSVALESVDIPEGVTSFGDKVFYGCFALRDETIIPTTARTLGTQIFGNCYSLPEIDLPSGLTTVPIQMCYCDHTLRSVVIPEGVTDIGQQAFYNCYALGAVELPSTLTTINMHAFYYCKGLTKIVFPAAVSSIAQQAFAGCTSLGELDFVRCTAVPTLGAFAFMNLPADCQILVPQALYDEWIAATNWSTYASQIVAVG